MDQDLERAFGQVRTSVADAFGADAEDQEIGAGDWITTFTGLRFRPLTPRAADVRLADIAHALAMTCRYGGHCRRFYSVAEHSVLIAKTFLQYRDAVLLARWALLHDAAEAYVGDIVRPLKHSENLAGFREAEDRISGVIWARFGLPQPTGVPGQLPLLVAEADFRIILDERAQLFDVPVPPRRQRKPLGVTLMCWSPERAEAEFLNLASTLRLMA